MCRGDFFVLFFFFFQAEDGIRDLVRSRGLGDVYKRQGERFDLDGLSIEILEAERRRIHKVRIRRRLAAETAEDAS